MKRFSRSMWATGRSALLEATANRRAFAFQAIVMILNDLAWIGFWVIFFHKAGTVRGWNTDQLILLQAVLTTGGGISLGFLANARHLSRIIGDGGLDAALSLPVRPLAHLLVRKFEPIAMGDVLFGIGLFVVAGHPSLERTALFVFAVVASTVLLTSFLVLVGSLTFFTGKGDSAEIGFNSILVLGAYPVDLFAGSSKLFLYTVVPAAFIATVPAKLIEHFDVGSAVALVGSASSFAIAGAVTFRLGLRRYASGSVWTRA